MKEHPILYSTPMIQAKLDGRKTQTRRIIKQDLSKHYMPNCEGRIEFFQGAWGCKNCGAYHATESLKCPYGKVGDVLWSREAWNHALDECGNPNGDSFRKYLYRASGDGGKWKPSIHQPKVAARIWERIKNIRVERLQDITEEDAISEGVGVGFQMNSGWFDYTRIVNGICEVTQDCARMSYATLWESINGEGSWNLNPWVWAITTEILSTTGRPKELSDELILDTPER